MHMMFINHLKGDKMHRVKFVVNLFFAALLVVPVSASAVTLDFIVGTNDIADSAITTPKIADSAVSTSKIADGAITAAKLAPGAVVPAGYMGMKVVHKGQVDGVNAFNSVTAALNAITDASESNRYLVKVMPGVYDERVIMKSFIDISGSGQDNTVINYSQSAPDFSTVLWDNQTSATLENLKVTGVDAIIVQDDIQQQQSKT